MNEEGLSPAVVTDTEHDKTAARWRRAILNLSGTLLSACDERQDLSPFLMEAMHSALENLLVYGEADDLLALEEWLDEENLSAHQHAPAHSEAQTPGEQLPATQPLDVSYAHAPAHAPLADSPVAPAAITVLSAERRVNGERRMHDERRGVPRLNGEYRSGRDRRRTGLAQSSQHAQAVSQEAAPPEESADFTAQPSPTTH